MWRALTLAAVLTCASVARGDVVTEWNVEARDAVRAGSTPPPRASRAMAMLHASVYDAVNAVDQSHQPYRWTQPALPGTSKEAAAAAAGHRVLSALFPNRQAILDARLAQQLSDIGSGPPVDQGLTLGRAVADDMIAWRSNDGSDAPSNYTPTNLPGRWRPTPPGFLPALLPQWGGVVPFGIASPLQYRPPPPPALPTVDYATAVNEVKGIGKIDSVIRTPDQTEIAHFWSNGAGTETPPGHWNRIAVVVGGQDNNTLSENARMFAMLNVALADAAIVSWDCKYHYDFWRPITAIRDAEFDDNPLTTDDDNWAPLLTTPPFPEYTSGHSTFSGAAAEALASFFGTDSISFTVGSDGVPVQRSFDSFSDAALESGLSRIYGGIHYSFSNVHGLSSGGAVGQYVGSNLFGAIPEPALALGSMLGVLFTLTSRANRRAPRKAAPIGG
jgi:hypothetical protein